MKCRQIHCLFRIALKLKIKEKYIVLYERQKLPMGHSEIYTGDFIVTKLPTLLYIWIRIGKKSRQAVTASQSEA